MSVDYAFSLQEVWDRIKGWSHEQKLDHAKMVIENAVETHGDKLAVACSFGKDSLVILHLTRQYNPDVYVSFQNTLCQEVGVYRLKKQLTEEWNLNLIESRPGKSKYGKKITFWSCVEKYGFPGLKMRNRYIGTSNYPKCCYYLKEKPATLLYRKHSIEGTILGIQAAESNNRKHVIAKMGCMYYTKKEKIWKYLPLAFWNNDDVWRYIKKNKVPYPKEYDIPGVERLGCKFCTAYSVWEEKMNKLHPRIYRKIKRMMGKPTLPDFFRY